jgi:predicted nucleic acid-binding protein
VIWLLDTNIFIPALNGRPGVRDRLNQAAATGEVVTSVLVLGELLHGAQCSIRSAENVRSVEKELSRIRILPVTETISRRFADLKTALRRSGIAKSDVDLLIATTALEHDATLVTNDSALLAGDVPDLLVESWV